MTDKIQIDRDEILSQFNNRNTAAFGMIYSLFYDELFCFATRTFRDTEVMASDVIHDVFMSIWQSNTLIFNELYLIKSYLYVSIKNRFKDYITHKKYIEKHRERVISDQETLLADIVESEVYAIVNQAIEMLPEDCAQVLKYHIQGWNIREIALKMNKPERTVYSKKQEAISLLQKKISKKIFLQFLAIFPL